MCNFMIKTIAMFCRKAISILKGNRQWSVKKKKTSHPAIAATNPAHARVFAVSASATISKAGSYPDAAFPLRLKKPGTDLSNILHNSLHKKRYKV